jgi:hypothetical protein
MLVCHGCDMEPSSLTTPPSTVRGVVAPCRCAPGSGSSRPLPAARARQPDGRPSGGQALLAWALGFERADPLVLADPHRPSDPSQEQCWLACGTQSTIGPCRARPNKTTKTYEPPTSLRDVIQKLRGRDARTRRRNFQASRPNACAPDPEARFRSVLLNVSAPRATLTAARLDELLERLEVALHPTAIDADEAPNRLLHSLRLVLHLHHHLGA